MDRYTVNTAKSQTGFMDFIVQPTFEVLKSFLPLLAECISNLEKNKLILNEKIEFFNEKLSKFFLFFLKNFTTEELNEKKESVVVVKEG